MHLASPVSHAREIVRSRPPAAPDRYAGNQTALRRLSQISPRLQCKLTIGAVDDPLEAEADRVADHVMRMPDPAISVAAAPPQISRKCAACEEDEDQTLQTKPSAAPAPSEAPPIVHDVLRSSGQPLDHATRTSIEPRFGQDFSGVRIHTGPKAAESARSVAAHAYTLGNNIVFGASQYAPSTESGRRLLAHELAHVVQQGSASTGSPSAVGQQDDFRDESVGTIRHTVSRQVIQRAAGSADYQQGYQDALSGALANPGPRNEEAAADYNEGYAKGQQELNPQGPSLGPVAADPAPPVAAPGANENAGPPTPKAVEPASTVGNQSTAETGPSAANAANTPAPGPPVDTAAIDKIVAALQEPQENGVGNYPAAFGILNGMWIVVMMRTLEELKNRGQFDLLQTNSPENMPRVRVAIAAVAAKAAPPVTAAFATDNPAFGALPDDQQHEVATYLGLSWPLPQQAGGGTGGLTTGEKVVIGVLIGAAVVGGIALIVLSGGTTAPAVIAGISVAGDLAVGTEVAAGTTVVAELVAGGETAAAVTTEVTAAATEATVTATEATAATTEATTATTAVAATATRASLIAALRAAGVRFTESAIQGITRTVAGRIVWLETGTASAGLTHIMARHGAQFAQIGINSAEEVTEFLINLVATQAPIAEDAEGAIEYVASVGGVDRIIRIVIGANGFIVTAYRQ